LAAAGFTAVTIQINKKMEKLSESNRGNALIILCELTNQFSDYFGLITGHYSQKILPKDIHFVESWHRDPITGSDYNQMQLFLFDGVAMSSTPSTSDAPENFLTGRRSRPIVAFWLRSQ
jgi:hypothetical protein